MQEVANVEVMKTENNPVESVIKNREIFIYI